MRHSTLPSRILLKAILQSVCVMAISATHTLAAGQGRVGGIIKVGGDLQGERFAQMQVTVKSHIGNLLAVELPASEAGRLASVRGVAAVALDLSAAASGRHDSREALAKYAGAGAVIGILDNRAALSAADMALMQKTDRPNGVVFISYRSDDPSSTVIIRNIGHGESDMMQALAYMREYARTVGKPLVVEMRLQDISRSNPLFAQACQQLADEGAQFIGQQGLAAPQAEMQLAVSMARADHGTITDRMPYWGLAEVAGREMMLVGSDGRVCALRFGKHGAVSISNASSDLVLLSVMGADGTAHSFHLKQSEAEVHVRQVGSGHMLLDDGQGGILPFMSKSGAVSGDKEVGGMRAIAPMRSATSLPMQDGSGLSMAAEDGRKLVLRLNGIRPGTGLELSDHAGNAVYRKVVQAETTGMEARIDLSGSLPGVYFLRVFSIAGEQVFALML